MLNIIHVMIKVSVYHTEILQFQTVFVSKSFLSFFGAFFSTVTTAPIYGDNIFVFYLSELPKQLSKRPMGTFEGLLMRVFQQFFKIPLKESMLYD